MKKMMLMMAMVLTMVTSASAMSYSEAKDHALFLADKMAYELNLSDEQYEAVYEINLDYLMRVNDSRTLYGSYWSLRNTALESVLSAWQWTAFRAAAYFYRPLSWIDGRWSWPIYTRYNRDRFYRSKPKAFTSYRGGARTPSYYSSRTWNAPQKRTSGVQKRTYETSRQSVDNQRRALENNRKSYEASKQQYKQSRKELNQAQRQADRDRKSYEKEQKQEQKQAKKASRTAKSSKSKQAK